MKNRRAALLAFLAVTAMFGCSQTLAAKSAADIAAAEAAVRRVDADWAARASTGGVDAWLAFYSADAIVLLPRGQLASGKELVRPGVSRLLALPQLLVSWQQNKVEVAASGDLAYLIGAYELRFADPHGVLVADRGRLMEIWREQTDGTWKCFVDTWLSEEPTATSSQATHPKLSSAAAISTPEPPAADSVTGAMTAAQARSKYGDMPTHYEELIRKYFQDHLKDPDSVQYQDVTAPEKAYITTVSGSILSRETQEFGWTVKATINAKSYKGRYVGFKQYTFLFRGEKIIDALLPLPAGEFN